jgi:phosphoribosylanthranilate isomerase
MALAVKICGLTDPEALAAAVDGGARWLGFVFYPPSPRALSPERAGDLVRTAPPDRTTVGVFVDPDDALLDRVLARVPLAALQLHGAESPERVRAIKVRTGCAVIKALQVAESGDLAAVPSYAAVADMLLFDARPPKDPASLPGGNGLAFDWRLLEDLRVGCPWLLSGGLSADNLAAAVMLCRPPAVDVSSGVESRPGCKDLAKVRRFLALAAALAAPEPAACTNVPQPARRTPASSSCS